MNYATSVISHFGYRGFPKTSLILLPLEIDIYL